MHLTSEAENNQTFRPGVRPLRGCRTTTSVEDMLVMQIYEQGSWWFLSIIGCTNQEPLPYRRSTGLLHVYAEIKIRPRFPSLSPQITVYR